MKRAAACLGAAVVCATALACNDAPTVGAQGGETSACAPLAEPGATVTAEALTKDGHYVVVVAVAGPTNATRVFYGVAAHMVEGAVTGVHQSCALEVDFDVAGRSEVATFSPGPPACAVASTLTSGNRGDAIVQVPLTVLIPAASDAGAGDAGAAAGLPALTFFCSR